MTSATVYFFYGTNYLLLNPGMAISGTQLAEILKSFGASPEDIAAAAAELAQSVVCICISTYYYHC